MKAITLWQPWASLVAIGMKEYETRSWPTAYRGPLAIHAAKRMQFDQAQLCVTAPFKDALGVAFKTVGDLPLGAVLCVCELLDVVRVESIRTRMPVMERAFGDYSDGRWAWKLKVTEQFDVPVPAKGFQQLWDWQRQ